jgi:hypothetical protein
MKRPYLKLKTNEKSFVDDLFSAATYRKAKMYGVTLPGDDSIERAIDKLAEALIASREVKHERQKEELVPLPLVSRT